MSKYVMEIMNYPNLPKEVTETLIFENKQNNSCARQLLIDHNLKIAVGLANEFQGDIDLSIDELINIGSLGLIEAVDTYEGSNANDFTKFVYLNIKNEFYNYLENLNKIDGNLYDTFDQLQEKTVSFNNNTYVSEEPGVEEIVLNRIVLEEIRKLLNNYQSAKQYKKTPIKR